MLVVELSQTDASLALGISVNSFIAIRSKYNMTIKKKRKRYQIPVAEIDEDKRDQYLQSAFDSNKVKSTSQIDPVEDDLGDVDLPSISSSSIDDLQAEKLKIDIKWKQSQILLNEQKNEKQKQLIFDEWSENFLALFAKNFSALKNEIINLRLTEEQNNKLKSLIERCLVNLEADITSEGIFNNNEQEEE